MLPCLNPERDSGGMEVKEQATVQMRRMGR